MEYKLRTPKLLPLPKKAVWGGGFLEWEKAGGLLMEKTPPSGITGFLGTNVPRIVLLYRTILYYFYRDCKRGTQEIDTER